MPELKDKIDFDLNILAKEALGILKKYRSREVLALRFGLDDKKVTLEKIGRKYGITRERVRQIEKAALNKIKNQKLDENDHYKYLFDIVKKEGIIKIRDLENTLGKNQINACRLLLNLTSNIYEIIEDDHKKAAFVDTIYQRKTFDYIIKKAIDSLKEKNETIALSNLVEELIDGEEILNHKTIEKILSTSKHIVVDGHEVGLAIWPAINPKSIKDKTYYILRKKGEPLHFSHIAEKVKDLSLKDITKQAVHNELIRDERFILIGRGIYALSEWGYSAGTVADIIVEILNKEKTLHKNNIIKKVLEKRVVKESTIILNLQNKNKFVRVGKATYSIKE